MRRLLIPDTEVAHLLCISRRSVWNHRRTGILPQPIRVGRRTLWRAAEIERWVEKQKPVTG